MLQKAKGPALLALMLIVVIGGVVYWRYLDLYPSTDDAYVTADIVKVAPQVSGEVKRIYFAPNQLVEQGDPLFDIDSTRHDIEIDNAYTQFTDAVNLAGDKAKDVSAVVDRVAERRKAAESARTAYFETRKKYKSGEVDQAALRESSNAVRTAETAHEQALDELDQQIDKIDRTSNEQVQLRLGASTVLRVETERAHTRLSAPISGWISGGDVIAGDLALQGRPAFSIIGRDGWWVDAHFKETDLGRIRPGQKASIRLDMYPGLRLDGAVGSISAGSGATFSLLPPENATGNWVKVTQRFTVRIDLKDMPQQDTKPLRAGASAVVTVDTADGAGLMSALAGTASKRK